MWPLLAKAYRNNGLEMEDLPRCSVDDQTEVIMKQLVLNWQQERKKKNPRFNWTLFRTFAGSYVIPFSIFIFEVLYKLVLKNDSFINDIIVVYTKIGNGLKYLSATIVEQGYWIF